MKKTKYLLLLMCIFILTGCVKMNASMKINKDKSMDYEVIIAMNEQLVGTNQVLNEEQIKKAKKNGYKLSEYKDEEMKGYKIVKHINNIDTVSTTKKIESNLDVDSSDKYFFTVKKGFFKNTYKAKLKTNSTSNLTNQLNDSNDNEKTEIEETDDEYNIEDEEETDNEYNIEDEEETDDEYKSENDINLSDETDLSSYTENMEFSFEIKLPYKAKKNNATDVKNGGKTLSWNLLQHQESIEFEFELYNLTNIYLTVGCIIAIITIVIVFILKKKKKAN